MSLTRTIATACFNTHSIKVKIKVAQRGQAAISIYETGLVRYIVRCRFSQPREAVRRSHYLANTPAAAPLHLATTTHAHNMPHSGHLLHRGLNEGIY